MRVERAAGKGRQPRGRHGIEPGVRGQLVVEAQKAGLRDAEVGGPIVVEQPGQQQRLVSVVQGQAALAEGEAANRGQRHVRAGQRQAGLGRVHIHIAADRHPIAADAGQLLAVQPGRRAHRVVHRLPAGQVQRQRQIDGFRRPHIRFAQADVHADGVRVGIQPDALGDLGGAGQCGAHLQADTVRLAQGLHRIGLLQHAPRRPARLESGGLHNRWPARCRNR